MNNKSPLVLDIHGFSSSSFQQESFSGMKEMAQKENFVVIWPSGSINQVGLRYFDADFCCNTTHKKRDDVALMREIIRRVKSKLLIDEKRIYATGLSNGGALTYQLYCKASDLFAAYAPLVFNLGKRLDCNPVYKRPLFSFNSIQDSLIPHEGGVMPTYGEILSTHETNLRIADINRCDYDFEAKPLKGNSVCMKFKNCAVDFHHCNLDNPDQLGGGHLIYFNDDNLNIAEEIWGFFKTKER